MEKEKSNLILGISLALVFLITIGISYAYFAAKIIGNESTSTIALSSGKMEIVYEDNTATINLSGIYPREEEWATKRFTLTGNNTTNNEMKYKIGISIEQNTFTEGALTYTLKNTLNEGGTPLEDVESTIIKTSGTQYIGYGIFDAKTNSKKHNYELKIFFKNNREDQNDNQKARFNAKIIVESCTDEELITLTFNPNEGTLTETTKTVLANGVYGTLPTPTRSGYEFLGWNGKNMFDEKSIFLDSANAKYENGYYVFGTTALTHLYFDFKENQTYTFQMYGHSTNNRGKTTAYRGRFVYADGTNSGESRYLPTNDNNVDDLSYAKHLSTDKKISSLSFIYGNATGSMNYVKYAQLEEGSKITEYEPYYVTEDLNIVQHQDHTLKAIWKEIT